MSEPQRRLAAIMFTDIVGFTSLSAKDEEEALRLIDKQRELLLPVVEEFKGEWLKEMGDGLLICFPSSIMAVRCGIKIQEKSKSIPDLNLRIGIHQGDILHKDGDVFGDDVNVASRMEPFAAPGGIAVSEKIAGDLSGIPDIKLKYIGTPLLKGVKQALKVYCIISHGLPETRTSQVNAKLEKKAGKWWHFAIPAAVLVFVYLGLIMRSEPNPIDTIAVLPLTNTVNDPEKEYFVDGMTESLITELSKIKSLKVISRNAVKKFKNTDLDIRDIAKDLHVGAVVEGGVFIDGGKVRISAQLTDVINNQSIWAEKYERDLSDILIVQSEVALAIAHAVKAAITPDEMSRISAAGVVNPELYDKYLKGNAFLDKLTPESIESGLRIYHEILETDPNFYTVQYGLAKAYLNRFLIKGDPSDLEKFQLYAETLLKNGQESEKIFFLLGETSFFLDSDLVKAGEYYKRALELNPNAENILNSYGVYLQAVGKFEESIDIFARASQVNPLSHISTCNSGFSYLGARQYDEAIQRSKHTKEHFGSACQMEDLVMAISYNKLGFHDKALNIIAEKSAESDLNLRLIAEKGYTFGLAGNLDSAEHIIDQIELMEKRSGRVFPYFKSIIYTGMGQAEKAIDLLELSFERREIWVLFLRFDPHFDPLHGDERFDQILVNNQN